jgi:hypothetical protein
MSNCGIIFFMAENASPNWQKLADNGIEMTASIDGGYIEVDNLPLNLALKMAIALTLNLDGLGSSPSYSARDYSFEQILADTQERLKPDSYHYSHLFGELRPARADMAVRVEYERTGRGHKLVAGIRNKYSDHPELEGSIKLQRIFNETVESLEL